MIFIILLIYFILLIIIECVFLFSSGTQKSVVKLEKIDNIDSLDLKKNKLKNEKSDTDLDIKNYIGKFLIKNSNGFFINLDNWNLLEKNILYDFLMPVNIKIIKIKKHEDLEYLIS